jgi:autotransporter-associated beta strand protein/T5SS/PEP-CTERM-associated repeat protein
MLQITNAGTLLSGSGYIADGASATGAVLIRSAGSNWTLDGPLFVGGTDSMSRGMGSLHLEDQATLSAASARVWGGKGSVLLGGSAVLKLGSLMSDATASFTLPSGAGVVELSSSSSIAGPIAGTGDLVKRGAGTLLLSGSNSWTGDLLVDEGTVELSRSAVHTNIAGTRQVVVASGATLNVEKLKDGRLNLGASQAMVLDGALVGSLWVSGHLSGSGTADSMRIEPSGTLELISATDPFTISGSTAFAGTYTAMLDAGTGYALLEAGGSVDITGASLRIALLSAPSLGDSFTLIQSSGSAAITGEFDGLGEGELLEAVYAGQTYVLGLTYMGNVDAAPLANDIVLEVVAVPEPASGLLVAALAALACHRRWR